MCAVEPQCSTATRPSEEELREHFHHVQTREFPHEQTITRSLLRDLALSRSSVAMLPAAGQRALSVRLEGLWEVKPELQNRDIADPSVAAPGFSNTSL